MAAGQSMESGLLVQRHVNKAYKQETEPAITHHLVKAVSRAKDWILKLKSVTLAHAKV